VVVGQAKSFPLAAELLVVTPTPLTGVEMALLGGVGVEQTVGSEETKEAGDISV
jgi:hypothetical protein